MQKSFYIRSLFKQLLIKYQVFTKMLQISHFIKYYLNFLDQLLLTYKFYGSGLPRTYFLIAASCERLTLNRKRYSDLPLVHNVGGGGHRIPQKRTTFLLEFYNSFYTICTYTNHNQIGKKCEKKIRFQKKKNTFPKGFFNEIWLK